MKLGLWAISVEDGRKLFLRNLPITIEIDVKVNGLAYFYSCIRGEKVFTGKS
ncbi:MAG: hypothetical protein AAF806_16440 [Bacteroidota bacterium]